MQSATPMESEEGRVINTSGLGDVLRGGGRWQERKEVYGDYPLEIS